MAGLPLDEITPLHKNTSMANVLPLQVTGREIELVVSQNLQLADYL